MSTLHPLAVVESLATGVRAAVLVEGLSDQQAVKALAARTGRDLTGEGVAIVPMGGATSIGTYLELLGPRGAGLRLAGLCDVAEEPYFRRGLERSGIGSGLDREAMAGLGFHVCVEDLEDELIRSLGVDRVVELVDGQDELRSFRVFQGQPAQRDKSVADQLRRFLGTRSGRKIRYGRVLVEGLDMAWVPRPLTRVLTHV